LPNIFGRTQILGVVAQGYFLIVIARLHFRLYVLWLLQLTRFLLLILLGFFNKILSWGLNNFDCFVGHDFLTEGRGVVIDVQAIDVFLHLKGLLMDIVGCFVLLSTLGTEAWANVSHLLINSLIGTFKYLNDAYINLKDKAVIPKTNRFNSIITTEYLCL
jgi:hypothetical protein